MTLIKRRLHGFLRTKSALICGFLRHAVFLRHQRPIFQFSDRLLDNTGRRPAACST